MFLAILILAVSVSIDSFGIGITYGIRNTTINKLSSFALFIISFLFSGFSILVGNVIFSIISEHIVKLISVILLIGINKSNTIELNEAIYLSIALSIDSFCVGISSASFGLFGLLYPFLVPVFQLFLLNLGIILGKKITKIHFLNYIPLKFWNMISGILLIAIGIIRIFI